ncbi:MULTISPECIES: protein translocase subunit SecD [Candidatus Ichthyocystis]|uniref:Protein translocase subunit SecD n=1 Tax=Candidatus Ichthyocystis hellenicum TaxID=1561003 RepID=A0A0S4M5M8_9BURK|nr:MULTISPECIES: protein translocase subunit SecD [Ichthyocystis]CUT18026.1 preprotein translocase subunit SecD [Candidatus Ichthyocystis hellenicum]
MKVGRFLFLRGGFVFIAVVLMLLYALPNFFGDSPAVQMIPAHSGVKIDESVKDRVASALNLAKIPYDDLSLIKSSLRLRLFSTDDQLKARDLLDKEINGDSVLRKDYTIAVDLLSSSPGWLSKIHAVPMYLGLDLRGGVHFLFQVDVSGAIKKYRESSAFSLRNLLRRKHISHAAVLSRDDSIEILFWSPSDMRLGIDFLRRYYPDLYFQERVGSGKFLVTARIKPKEREKIISDAIQHNVTTLHRRVNELGVSEPLIQQQGKDRIVVELPGVQDVAQAKKILGKTATLEMHMLSSEGDQLLPVDSLPSYEESFPLKSSDGDSKVRVVVNKAILLTGDHIIRADADFDRNNQPAVSLQLDSSGAEIFRELTRENVGKRLAIVLLEDGLANVVTAPRINEEIPNGRVQITGSFTFEEAGETALLLRAGSLAAPMDIVEERTIGPRLGAENIKKGVRATLSGLFAIALFMVLYYRFFGFISVISLVINLLFLVAILSILQATLTLPGIAAIALTLGMAIDANVLINERIREELRSGALPVFAIREGYSRAFSTIIDSNVTTLIAGVALLIFGSGPIRGFAVVHCIGIGTSLFSSVVISRTIVDLVYLRRSPQSVSIGQIWKSNFSAND